eukprot:2246680-Pyramimonas_sp.AAC.1
MALRSLEVGVVEIASDCQLVVDVWAKGPDQDFDRLAYSELWVQIFQTAQDYGIENITLRKVRSHLSLTKALEVGMPIWAWKGNNEADRLAGEGAKLHPTNPRAKAEYVSLSEQ